MQHDENLKIEVVHEVTESTGDPLYKDEPAPIIIVREQTTLSIIGLVLALPFPILIIVLWITLNLIKGSGSQVLGSGTMNAVLLYLVQFFLVPLLSVTSIVIGFIVTLQSKEIAKKIGYISFGVTGVGLILLGLFLNNT
jgi:hypothetical protein